MKQLPEPSKYGLYVGSNIGPVENALRDYREVYHRWQEAVKASEAGNQRKADAIAERAEKVIKLVGQGLSVDAIYDRLGSLADLRVMPNTFAKEVADAYEARVISAHQTLEEAIKNNRQRIQEWLDKKEMVSA